MAASRKVTTIGPTARPFLTTPDGVQPVVTAGDPAWTAAERSRIDRLVDSLARYLLNVGIDGVRGHGSADALAARALRKRRGDPAHAARWIVRSQGRVAGTGGFVTGLGGFVTLPVALPTNVLEFYLLATRTVAAVAAVHGYDLRREEVRTAVLLTLTGQHAADVLRRAGVDLGTDHVTAAALRRLPAPVLMVVDKGVAFHLIVKLGEKTLTRLGRVIPLAGGVVGGVVDLALLHRIAADARARFRVPPTEPYAEPFAEPLPAPPAGPVVRGVD